ncbi:a-macroglobulin complement component [Stylonychia lemnae]|uniref:A-macroglobulin complement component n=1 Tax=Stylonychia lemnae TaxID=5949 RepID=A0A078A443_STYLE|nr:a-macroglobulin complement component [Stylonychia lemnae]|eukprot:CDW76907.1 a-macroglobulin complement component [Stylonychia lemnae]
MQLIQNPQKLGILATLLTITTFSAFQQAQSSFLIERLSFNRHRAPKVAPKQAPLTQHLLEDTHPLLNSAFTYNLTWLQNQIVNATDDYVPLTAPRIHASIKLDKENYRPRDVVFVEVLAFNALNKTPTALAVLPANDVRNQYYNLNVEIFDSSANRVFAQAVQANLSTAVTSFKLPANISAGVYTVRASNSFVANVATSFTVQTYPKDSLVVSTQLTQASYNPGDTVSGIVRVTNTNGQAFNATPTLQFNVTYGNSSSNTTNITLSSSRADAVFSFVVPRTLNTSFATITYTVRSGSNVHVYQQPVNINNAELLVVDAFSATGYLVNNVPNVVYFQAWQTAQRQDTLDFSNAVLRQSVRLNATATGTVTSVVAQVSSVARGRGSFVFTPVVNQTALTLELTINGQIVRRSIAFGVPFNQTSNTAEVAFRILNNNRVLNNNEDLQLQFLSNAAVNSSDDYVVQIKLKEQVVFQDQLSFNTSSVRNYTVLARLFPLINGGVLSVNLFRLTPAFEQFYKSKPTIIVTVVNTTTNGTRANTTNTTTNASAANTTNTTKVNTTTTNSTNATNSTKPTANATNTTNTTKPTTNTTNTTNTTKPANGTNSTSNTTTNTTTTTTTNVTTIIYNPPDVSTPAQVVTWLEPKGELIFYKRPNEQFRLNITLDRSAYAAGDQVTYSIQVLNATTGRVVTTDSYVTVTAVDVLGYQRPGVDLGLPAPLATRLHLSQEIAGFDNERLNSLQGLNGALSGNDTKYIDLLFGLQSWRVGLFDVRSLIQLSNVITGLSTSDRQAVQGLYNYIVQRVVVQTPATNTTTNTSTGNLTNGTNSTNTTSNTTRPTTNTTNTTTNTTRPTTNTTSNTTNSTTNTTRPVNTTNGTSNGTTNSTVTPTVTPIVVRSGEQGNVADPTDYMTGTIAARNWSHPLRANFNTASVEDLTATVLFQSAFLVRAGVATGRFFLNDRLTNYVLTVDAFNANGTTGSGSVQFGTVQNFAVSADAPAFMVNGDSLKLPVNITNLGTTVLSVRLTETSSNGTTFRVNSVPAISVPAGQTVRTFVTATALRTSPGAVLTFVATATLTAAGSTRVLTATTTRSVVIGEPIGVRRSQLRGSLIGSNARPASNSSNLSNVNLQLNLTNELNQSSSQYSFTVYPNILSLVEASGNALAQSPKANFEQVASSLYPAFLRLQLLRSQVQTADSQVLVIQLTQEVQGLLEQLLTYRIPTGSNSRFDGQDISNEAMTAFALQYLFDLQNITRIDSGILSQLSGYLVARKNNRGGFMQSFSNPLATSVPEVTLNAYIVNALAAVNANITAELNAVKAFVDAQISQNRVDSYILAQLAQALFRARRNTEALVYADALVKLQAADGSVFSNQDTTLSAFLSNGTELTLETTSIAIQVWSNNQAKYITQINNAANYLLTNINDGLIGGAQSTTLALKALNLFFANSNFPTINGNGNLTLTINDLPVQTVRLVSGSTDTIRFDASAFIANNSRLFAAGQSLNINVAVSGFNLTTGQARDFRAIFSVAHRFILNGTYSPPAPLNLTSDFQVTIVNSRVIGSDNSTGRAFTIAASFQNVFPAGSSQSGQLNIVLHPPSCLVLDEAATNVLASQGVINSYQIIPSTGQVVLFVNSMLPGQSKTVNTPFVQRFAGSCLARDNFIYQAYGDFEIYSSTRLA